MGQNSHIELLLILGDGQPGPKGPRLSPSARYFLTKRFAMPFP
jgi:hypothetical protein